MKKNILVFLLMTITSTAVFLFSCQHEPVQTCDEVGFHITVTKTDAIQNTPTGTITVTASGGSGFKYSLNAGPLQDTGYFPGLEPFQTYRVVGYNSMGCTDTVVVSIGSINPCQGVNINITATKTDATANQSNGSITATATGGTGFTYSINGGAFQSSGTFSNLAAGNYTIAAQSDAGCLGTTQVTVGTINPCSGVNITVATTQVNPTLNQSNGSITATASGSTGFSYSINGGTFQASGTFGNLAAGTYIITAKNADGCSGTKQVTLTGTNPCTGVTITIVTTQVNPTINQSNGSITATASGSTGFTYSINGGAYQSGGTFSNLAAGTYTITAKNSNGCTGTKQVTLTGTNPCSGVTVSITTTTVNPTTGQSNGSITATATGGSGFTYSLNGGAFQASGTFSNLAAGNYTITAKNSNGCTGLTTVALGSTNPCAGVTVTVTTAQVNPVLGQSNGSITASATGGSGFTYSINNGTFQASGTFSNLAAGTYTITAKNSNGCIGTKQVTLTATDPCAGITVVVTTTQVNPTTGSSNGSITASATGGSGFTYSINGGAFQASGTFSNLAAGNYTITAKNSNGCIGTKQVTLTATDPCAGITVVVTTTQVNPTSGANGSITASATGGSGFTYSINGGAFQASGTFSNLAAGTYTITAKNSNGCTGTKQVTLAASNPCTNVNIVITATVVHTTPCQAATNNGSITITATGSTGLTYNIAGGAYQTSNVFANLNAGSYLVGVKDANGCTKTQTVTVGVVPKGPLFTQVRSIISAKCGNCHLNGGNTAGYNFDSDCSIITNWSQINKACVTYQLVQMPPSQQLPASEKASITNWVNAGHRYTD